MSEIQKDTEVKNKPEAPSEMPENSQTDAVDEVDFKQEIVKLQGKNKALLRDISSIRQSRRELNEKVENLQSVVDKLAQNSAVDYDYQIQQLKDLRDLQPDKADGINDKILELMLEKKISKKFDDKQDKKPQPSGNGYLQEEFDRSANAALELIPDLSVSTSENCKRGLEIGVELGLLKEEGGKYVPVHPNAPLIIAKQILAENSKTNSTESQPKKKKITVLDGKGSSNSGEKSLKQMTRDEQRKYLKATSFDLRKFRR